MLSFVQHVVVVVSVLVFVTEAGGKPCSSTVRNLNGTCDITCNSRTQYFEQVQPCRGAAPYCCTQRPAWNYSNVTCKDHTSSEVADIFQNRVDNPEPWFDLFYCCLEKWLRGIIIPPPLSLMVLKAIISVFFTLMIAILIFYVMRGIRLYMRGKEGVAQDTTQAQRRRSNLPPDAENRVENDPLQEYCRKKHKVPKLMEYDSSDPDAHIWRCSCTFTKRPTTLQYLKLGKKQAKIKDAETKCPNGHPMLFIDGIPDDFKPCPEAPQGWIWSCGECDAQLHDNTKNVMQCRRCSPTYHRCPDCQDENRNTIEDAVEAVANSANPPRYASTFRSLADFLFAEESLNLRLRTALWCNIQSVDLFLKVLSFTYVTFQTVWDRVNADRTSDNLSNWDKYQNLAAIVSNTSIMAAFADYVISVFLLRVSLGRKDFVTKNPQPTKTASALQYLLAVAWRIHKKLEKRTCRRGSGDDGEDEFYSDEDAPADEVKKEETSATEEPKPVEVVKRGSNANEPIAQSANDEAVAPPATSTTEPTATDAPPAEAAAEGPVQVEVHEDAPSPSTKKGAAAKPEPELVALPEQKASTRYVVFSDLDEESMALWKEYTHLLPSFSTHSIRTMLIDMEVLTNVGDRQHANQDEEFKVFEWKTGTMYDHEIINSVLVKEKISMKTWETGFPHCDILLLHDVLVDCMLKMDADSYATADMEWSKILENDDKTVRQTLRKKLKPYIDKAQQRSLLVNVFRSEYRRVKFLWFLPVPALVICLPFLLTHWIPGLVLYFPWILVIIVVLGSFTLSLRCCLCGNKFSGWLDLLMKEVVDFDFEDDEDRYELEMHGYKRDETKTDEFWMETKGPKISGFMDSLLTFRAVLFFWLLRAALGFLLLLAIQVPMNYIIMTYDDHSYVTTASNYTHIVADEFNMRSAKCFTLLSLRDVAAGASALFYVV